MCGLQDIHFCLLIVVLKYYRYMLMNFYMKFYTNQNYILILYILLCYLVLNHIHNLILLSFYFCLMLIYIFLHRLHLLLLRRYLNYMYPYNCYIHTFEMSYNLFYTILWNNRFLCIYLMILTLVVCCFLRFYMLHILN